MIHPFNNEQILEEMANLSEPQTDREWMMKIVGELKRFGEIIQTFGDKLESFELNEIKELKKEISMLKEWRSEWNGSWKLVIIIGITASLVLSIVTIITRLK